MDGDLDRAFALHAEGRTGEAVAVLRAVVARAPDAPDAHLVLASLLVGLDEFDDAAEHARLAAERAWNDPFMLVRAASAAWHADPAAAQVYLGRVDELTGWAPHFALQTEAWHLKGLLAWNAGDREAALAWLERAFAADPATLGLGADLALAYAQCGRDATEVITRALEHRPGDERLLGLRSQLS